MTVFGAADLVSAPIEAPANMLVRELNRTQPQEGRQHAYEQMVMEHLPAVRYIARRLHERLPQHVELEDLISAGVLGLIDACGRFDPERHVRFKSYAQFRIRGAMLDSLRLLDWSPRDLRRRGRDIEEATRVLTQRLGRVPVAEEIAAAMQVSLEQLQQLQGDLKGLEMGSLNAERSDESNDEELDHVPAAAEYDPLFCCIEDESRQALKDAMEELPEKERLVLTLYYYEELTMREIGLTLGVVESRVSQVHAMAVRRLRGLLSGGTEASESGMRLTPGRREGRLRKAA